MQPIPNLTRSRWSWPFQFWLMVICCYIFLAPDCAAQNLREVVSDVQPKIVKIMGSGGFQGLEPYQTGILISAEGYILTAWSYVLDKDGVVVTLDDGQRFFGKLVGYDPRIEIAVLKIDAEELPHFVLSDSASANIGDAVLAFSNLYGIATGNESASVQRGIVAAEAKLTARRGAFATEYRDSVYIVDAIINNPGASGGALTDIKGRLTGMIGKEVKDENTNGWLNFAIPIHQIESSVDQIRDGQMVIQSRAKEHLPSEPITLELLGVVLVPNVVRRTPPFIDRIIAGSPGEQQGLKLDDLIIEIDGHLTPSISEVARQLSQIDRDDDFELTVQRNGDFVTLKIGLNQRLPTGTRNQ